MPPRKRQERRNISPGALQQVIVAAKADAQRAAERYERIAVVLGSHTLWEHEDGRDICDYDGSEWPCATIVGLAWAYGVEVREHWERRDLGKRESR